MVLNNPGQPGLVFTELLGGEDHPPTNFNVWEDYDLSAIVPEGTQCVLLHIANADVNMSGGSTGKVNVNGTVNVDLSEGSKLYYRGNPTWGTKNIAEGSKLIKR